MIYFTCRLAIFKIWIVQIISTYTKNSEVNINSWWIFPLRYIQSIPTIHKFFSFALKDYFSCMYCILFFFLRFIKTLDGLGLVKCSAKHVRLTCILFKDSRKDSSQCHLGSNFIVLFNSDISKLISWKWLRGIEIRFTIFMS